MSFAAMMHEAEGRLNALLTLKIDNYFVCLSVTRISAVSKVQWQLILPLITLRRIKQN
jgi:hypothetical protein